MPYIGKSPTGSGVRQRYHFTASGGETSLSGADDNSKTLKFTDGEYVDVYLNGVLLVQGTDYGVGTANTISSLAALAANDIVEVVVYDIYNVAKINSEAVRVRHYFTATGGETSIGTSQIAGLSFAANADIDVSLNGISLVAGTDYNTTTANTVGGLSALTAGQVVEIVIYEKFQLADMLSKSAGGTIGGAVTVNGTLTATSFSGDGSSLSGISSNAGSEYFEVDLTTDQASLTDASNVVVDFGGSGTVVYDTASNFDSSNDAYLLDTSNGVYIISFSCVVASNAPATETLIYGHAGIEVATDGSTYSPYKAGAAQVRTSNTVDLGSVHFSGSFIYKATTATTKIRLKAFAENSSSSSWRIPSTAANAVQVTGSSDLANARPTWMSIMRIA